jgi:thiamine-phosphate pyrophosphorylase
MAGGCRLYYVTDRSAFPGDEPARRSALLGKIAEATRAGVDYIQLREKDLITRELEQLAREVVRVVRENTQRTTGNLEPRTILLINSRTDVALAAGADGVHLRSDDILPQEVRQIWRESHVGIAAPGCPAAQSAAAVAPPASEPSPKQPLIGVSCHSAAEVVYAAEQRATFAVFAPVFAKKDAPGTSPAGLAALHEACRAKIPVLALGGVTLQNAQACLNAGAAGIAAIRLFQENNIASIVRCLRDLDRLPRC